MRSSSRTTACTSSERRLRPGWSRWIGRAILPLLLLLPQCGDPGPRLPPAGEHLPDRLETAYELAWTDRPQEAFEAFRKLYLATPALHEAWFGALAAARSRKEIAAIREDLKRLWPPAHGDEIIIFKTLRILLGENPENREKDLYRLAEEEKKNSLRGWALLGLGLLYFERGSLEAAVDVLEQALKETDDIPLAHRLRARGLMRLHRYKDAIDDLESYLQARPFDPIALYNLGWILLNVRNRPRDARPYLERALLVRPDDPDILIALGAAAMLAPEPDLDLAEECFKKALRISPDDPDIHLNLGILYADYKDDPESAIMAFRRYMELGGIRKERAERWIEEMRRRKRKKQ